MQRAGKHPLARVVPALHHKNYRIYSLGGILSIIGTWMQDVALGWYVLERTDSAALLGALVAAEYIPILLLTPLGGAIADRYDTRKLIAFAQVALGVCAFLLGFAVGVDAAIWTFFALSIARGLCSCVDLPARASFLSEMVPVDVMRSAAAFESLTWNLGRALGPLFAALLISNVNYSSCFYVNCLTYLALLLLTFALDREQLISAPVTAKARVRDGWRYLKTNADVRAALMSLAFIGTFAYNSATIFPLMAKFLFNGEVGAVAQLITAAGVGAIVCNLALARGGAPNINLLVWMAVLFAAVIALTGASPNLTAATVLTFFWGVTNVSYAVVANSLIQIRVDPMFRGRILAFRSALVFGSTAIGAPIIGLLVQFGSVRIMLETVAVLTACGGLAALWTSRRR